MTEESKGVPVADLSVEQVATLEKQLVSELEFFVESQNQLKLVLGRNDKSINALSILQDSQPGHTALIPLSESMYVKAELSDPSRAVVEIGTGYFAEMNRDKAQAFLERKKAYITKQIESLEKIIVDKRRMRAVLADALQQKIQAQLANMQMPPNR
ncbi:hypothetical protein WR25_10746 [Diploscapter pachys]|uniref:Prefoldin subunit 5 n=1 Tax=Diploscapter pachys TaxID=2018661 RepID=A0A2A2JBL8_9BILA|nr:hypothetical protein WR25_04099 [Diploscapter pachys]PAV59035.1 hypothetical protein WR25_10746 [Diploscapter pachys]